MNRGSGRAGGEFDAAYWEARYRSGVGAGGGRPHPSPSLVAAAGGLAPGTALDAGCGVGGDALWLAARGWRVTAADISATALSQGRRAADAAGSSIAGRITWLHADLSAWEPVEMGFDLVTSHYVHVPGTPQALFRRLASWVAPGGSLLVVGHAAGTGHGHADAHPVGAQLRAEQVVGCLREDQWEVLVGELRTHTMLRAGTGSGSPIERDDVVVHARRRAAPPS